MYTSYSPLFKLGLLAEHAPSSSPRNSPPLATHTLTNDDDDDASAIYFTFQTRKRDTAELRSFLYLDLADNTPYVPSHKHKLSILSKSTSWTCIADIKSVHDPIVRTEKAVTVLPPAPVAATRRRTSKESLRSIPSPKPAPSTTLPDLPITTDPCLPPPSSSKKRPASTVISSLLSPASRARRPASLHSESISSHDRRKSRRHALARLEGRSAPRAHDRVLRPTSLRNNFMSFSDDEDEKSVARKSRTLAAARTPVAQVEDLSAFADVEDEVDAIIPSLVRVREREPADPVDSARSAKLGRKRRSTLESWFPLKSFIDLKDDDLSSWNWRSFIEIGGVA